MWLWHWWPTMLTLGMVLWLTLSPDPVPEEPSFTFPGMDKVVHGIMMFGLTSVAIFDSKRATTARGEKLPARTVVVICLAMVVFSIADEMAQSAMGLGRQGDVMDFLADIAGIALAGLTAPRIVNWLFRERRERRL